jgi:NADH-quinone oxidoreductase subunit L
MPWLLAFIPFVAAMAVVLLPAHRRGLLALTAGLGAAATVAAAPLLLAAHVGGAVLAWSAALQLRVELPGWSALLAAMVAAVALPVLVYAALAEPLAGLRRLLALLLLFVGSMELVLVAADLLTLLIGWELMGACSWALIAQHWRDPQNPRSALYAFVMTRLGDLGLFVAAMALYAGTGSFAFDRIAQLQGGLLQLAAFGVLACAASKSGQLPFSPWLFRAMAGPAPVSALLHSATMVAAGVYLLARLQPALAPVPGFNAALIALGALTALAAGVVAVVQPNAKKLLAASSSAHFGMMFVAVGAGFPGVALLHLVAHAWCKSLLFLAAGQGHDHTGTLLLSQWRLGRVLPAVAVAAGFGAAALAGLPPLGAGWTKEALVAAAAARDGWSAVALVLAAGLSAAYAVRFWWLAFARDDPDPKAAGEHEPADPPGNSSARSPAGVTASLAWLVLGIVALSALWLAPVRQALAAGLGMALPEGSHWGTVALLLALAFGALGGRVLALRRPTLGEQGVAAAIADWWRLPHLIDVVAVRPVQWLAEAAARWDDAVVDGLPRIAQRLAAAAAGASAWLDERGVDRGVRVVARSVEATADGLAATGERLADGIAGVSASLVGASGTDIRRLHTGLSHQAFALLLAGTLVLIALVLIGGT